jgi:hypothetical protein
MAVMVCDVFHYAESIWKHLKARCIHTGNWHLFALQQGTIMKHEVKHEVKHEHSYWIC